MDNLLLYSKLAALPDNLKSKVADFIDSLVLKDNNQNRFSPKFGSCKGMFVMKEDFDQPLDDFKEYMY